MKREAFHKIGVTIVMSIAGIIFLLPFIWMISASLKPEHKVFEYPIQWITSDLQQGFSNYKQVWVGDYPFYLYYWNSIKVTVLTTLTSTFISCLAAYAFSKIEFKGKNLLFILVLATFMIPPQTTLVPQFIVYRWLGLFDTHLGIILLHSFSVLGTFMLRQFFMGVNSEYIEAAKMDGAGHFRIFSRIMIPLTIPAIATYSILRFIWTWNDYKTPLIFLRSEELYTIQLGMNKFSDVYGGQFYALTMAASVSAILPLLLIFLIAQKHVIAGISLGGVKG